MIEKCLKYFQTMNDFLVFSKFVEEDKWNIEKQLLKNRADFYSKFQPICDLKLMFERKQLSIWPLKDEEAVTWIDTMAILRRAMIDLFKKGIDASKTKIIMEYPLKYGNHMRSDYIIVYSRLILVLEFGMFNQDEKRSEERYTKKLQDSINYRQVIANSVSRNISIVNYTMIYRPEFDRDKSEALTENVQYNNQEIALLSEFMFREIQHQESLEAINQLALIT